MLRTAENLRKKFGLSSTEALKMSWDTAAVYELGGKIGTPGLGPAAGAGEAFGGASFGGGAKLRGVSETGRSAGESYQEALEFAAESNSGVSFGEAFSQLDRALGSKDVRERLSMTARDTEEARASLSSARSSLRDYSSHREKARAYSEVLSEESFFAAGLEREYTQAVFEDMRGLGHSDGYTARGLEDLRDGRYDTEEAEAVSGAVHRAAGLEELVGAGSMPKNSVTALPADGYGLRGVEPLEVDAESSFGEYRKSVAGERSRADRESSLDENRDGIGEEVRSARERVGSRTEAGRPEVGENLKTGRREMEKDRENLNEITRGVRGRVEKAKRGDGE